MRPAAGWIFPAASAGAVVVAARLANPSPSTFDGIALGVLLAALQSYLTTAGLWISRNKGYFLWFWAGGILFRLAVLIGIAWWIRGLPGIGFLATLMTMVVSTTVFLVVETAACLKG